MQVYLDFAREITSRKCILKEVDCSTVSAVSEHGSANFCACNLPLGSSNEHVVTQHCVKLCLVNVSDHLQAYVFGFFQQAFEIAIDWKPLKERIFIVES